MKFKRALVYMISIIVFINLPLWDFFTKDEYIYSNYDGSFQYMEFSGTGLPKVNCPKVKFEVAENALSKLTCKLKFAA